MGRFKLILEKIDGTKVWINVAHIIKMEKDINDRYYLYLINGEKIEVPHSVARGVEKYFQGN